MPVVDDNIELFAPRAFAVDNEGLCDAISPRKQLLEHLEPVQLGVITFGAGMCRDVAQAKVVAKLLLTLQEGVAQIELVDLGRSTLAHRRVDNSASNGRVGSKSLAMPMSCWPVMASPRSTPWSTAVGTKR